MSKRKILKGIDVLSGILLIVGGLVHLGQAFNYYVVDQLLGFVPFLPLVIYLAVGASAVWAIVRGFKKNYMR